MVNGVVKYSTEETKMVSSTTLTPLHGLELVPLSHWELETDQIQLSCCLSSLEFYSSVPNIDWSHARDYSSDMHTWYSDYI